MARLSDYPGINPGDEIIIRGQVAWSSLKEKRVPANNDTAKFKEEPHFQLTLENPEIIAPVDKPVNAALWNFVAANIKPSNKGVPTFYGKSKSNFSPKGFWINPANPTVAEEFEFEQNSFATGVTVSALFNVFQGAGNLGFGFNAIMVSDKNDPNLYYSATSVGGINVAAFGLMPDPNGSPTPVTQPMPQNTQQGYTSQAQPVAQTAPPVAPQATYAAPSATTQQSMQNATPSFQPAPQMQQEQQIQNIPVPPTQTLQQPMQNTASQAQQQTFGAGFVTNQATPAFDSGMEDDEDPFS
jgi:hypothetical protein